MPDPSLIERTLDRLFRVELVTNGCAGETDAPPYLKRWHVRRNPTGFNVYIHKILRPDAEREVHDHPWSFLSIIIAGGYWEETPLQGEETRRSRKWPGMVLFRRAEWQHRVHVDVERPAWTFFITGPKRREWGFWRGFSFTHWKRFQLKRCREDGQ